MARTYLQVLKQHGLSNTRARRSVFEALIHAKRAVTMRELIDLVSDIDRVSAYRVVDQFEKAGIVRRLQLGWKYKIELGDMFKAHHHHMTCTLCGKTYDFDEPAQLEAILESITRKHDFSLTEHTLELRGKCKHCMLKP